MRTSPLSLFVPRTLEPRCPYITGKTLDFDISLHPFEGREISASLTADVTIVKVFEPFTLSCTLLVELRTMPTRPLPNLFILKIYDRRFAEQLRRDNKASLWNPQIEDEYRKFVHDGSAAAFFKLCSEKDAVHQDWAYEARKSGIRPNKKPISSTLASNTIARSQASTTGYLTYKVEIFPVSRLWSR